MNTPGPTPQPASPASAPANGKRKFLLRMLLLAMVVVAIICTLWYFFEGRWHVGTEDAYVNGNIVQITPQSTGTVARINADDGNFVRKGDVLVETDGNDARIALQLAEAHLASTVRHVRGLYSNVESGQAVVDAQKTTLDRAREDFTRRAQLASAGAVSAEELSHARDVLSATESQLASTQQQLNTTRALVDKTNIAQHPDVVAAITALKSAYLNDARSKIYSPLDGYVAKRTVQVGQRLQPGLPLMAVVPLNQVWVDANFKETQLAKMRIGQPVKLQSDLYGGKVEFSGTVQSLGVGTGSAFSLLPAQNATGNWIKIVQRVPVRIKLDSKQLEKHPLRIGLSMSVDVNLRHQDGPSLAQQSPVQPLFTTDVFQDKLQGVQEKIADIIRNNSSASGSAEHVERVEKK